MVVLLETFKCIRELIEIHIFFVNARVFCYFSVINSAFLCLYILCAWNGEIHYAKWNCVIRKYLFKKLTNIEFGNIEQLAISIFLLIKIKTKKTHQHLINVILLLHQVTMTKQTCKINNTFDHWKCLCFSSDRGTAVPAQDVSWCGLWRSNSSCLEVGCTPPILPRTANCSQNHSGRSLNVLRLSPRGSKSASDDVWCVWSFLFPHASLSKKCIWLSSLRTALQWTWRLKSRTPAMFSRYVVTW